jgi:hypothetical protein
MSPRKPTSPLGFTPARGLVGRPGIWSTSMPERCRGCGTTHTCPGCQTPLPTKLDYDDVCSHCGQWRFRRYQRIRAEDDLHVSPFHTYVCPDWERVPPSEVKSAIQDTHSSKPTDGYSSLRDLIATNKIKGNERAIIETLIEHQGRISLAELADKLDWNQEDYGNTFNSARTRINKKLTKLPKPHFHLRRESNQAVLVLK